MTKKTIITCALIGAILAGTTLTGFVGWYSAEKKNRYLNSELANLRRQMRIATVAKSVSRQMEEIAVEQKAISDEQREEALEQTRIANELRERSEEERHNAIVAQQQALASERRALDAYDQAEEQRLMAEHQRIQAELAKRKADTLGFITLGQSLASLALKQYYVGDMNMAKLLGYAAYLFTHRYGGDLYNPNVFQALTLTSQSRNNWANHEGAITNMDLYDNKTKLISVSNYGEIMVHDMTGKEMKSTTIFKDNKYDFRDVWVGYNNNFYALSRTGHLLIKTAKGIQIVEVTGVTHPLKFAKLGNKSLIIGEDGMALFGADNKIEKARKFNFHVTCCGKIGENPVIFDDKGKMHHIYKFDSIVTRKVPVLGRVTDFDASKSSSNQAYGMSDGTIFIINKNGDIRRLVGHRSRISRLRVQGRRVFSASYDGTVNLWDSESEKPEPITLYQGDCWVTHFIFDKQSDNIWVGDLKGKLTEALISIPMMAEKIRKGLKRDMTSGEWNYYIGKNVRYESFQAPKRKEDK